MGLKSLNKHDLLKKNFIKISEQVEWFSNF